MIIKGFLIQDEGKWYLLQTPQRKTCCKGTQKEILIQGDFSENLHGKVVAFSGTLLQEGESLQLLDPVLILKDKIPIPWLTIGLITIAAVLSIRRKWLKRRLPLP